MPDRRVILTFHGIGHPPAHVDASEHDFWVDEALYAATLDEVVPRPATGDRTGAGFAGSGPVREHRLPHAQAALSARMTLDAGGGRDVDAVYAALRARRCRPRAFGVSAMRFTHGRGLRAARVAERARESVARRLR